MLQSQNKCGIFIFSDVMSGWFWTQAFYFFREYFNIVFCIYLPVEYYKCYLIAYYDIYANNKQ